MNGATEAQGLRLLESLCALRMSLECVPLRVIIRVRFGGAAHVLAA